MPRLPPPTPDLVALCASLTVVLAAGAAVHIVSWVIVAVFATAVGVTGRLAFAPCRRAIVVALASVVGLGGYVVIAGLWILALVSGLEAARTFVLAVLVPTAIVGILFAWIDPDVRAARRGTHYVALDRYPPEDLAIIAKHTNGTMRRRRFIPFLLGDGGRLTADDVRAIFAAEAAEEEARARIAYAQLVQSLADHGRDLDDGAAPFFSAPAHGMRGRSAQREAARRRPAHTHA